MKKKHKKPIIKEKKLIIGGEEYSVLIYKRKKTSYIRHRKTGDIIATSRKLSPMQLFNKASEEKITTRKGVKIHKSKVNIRLIQQESLTNMIRRDYGTYRRKGNKKAFFGQTFIGVLFYYNKTQYVYKEGGSRTPRILYKSQNRQLSLDEAYKGALSQIDFSPIKSDIIWTHYIYYDSKTDEEKQYTL